MPNQSMLGILCLWERMLAGVKTNRDDLPYVEDLSAQLDARLSDLKAELARRSALRSELRQSTGSVKKSMKAGRDLAGRIKSYLKARYGLDSEKLVEFGLKPLRQRRPGRSGPAQEKGGDGAPWNPTEPSGKQ